MGVLLSSANAVPAEGSRTLITATLIAVGIEARLGNAGPTAAAGRRPGVAGPGSL